jgi:HlyD family secretion protein
MKKTAIIGGLLVMVTSCGQKTSETKPIRKDVVETVFASGYLEAEGTYELTAQTEGYLMDVNFNEGDLVSKGQALAVIDNEQNVLNRENAALLYRLSANNAKAQSPALQQAKNNVRIKHEKLKQDSLQFIRYKQLFESKSIAAIDWENAQFNYRNSQTDYLNAQEAYAQQQLVAQQEVIVNRGQFEINNVLSGENTIRAVIAGKVFQQFKAEGDFVRKGDVIAVIGSADVLYGVVNIDDNSISKVKVGQPVVIQLNTSSEKRYKGIVAEILPAFDNSTQSFTCKVAFTDSLDFNIINTQLQVNIEVNTIRNALLIPRHYLDYGNLVSVKDKKKPVKVKTGFVSTDWVQILSGITDNSILVTGNLPQK